MTFTECLLMCASTPELVAEYNRLTGASLGIDARSPFERLIDDATGYAKELEEQERQDTAGFCAFVYHGIYKTLPKEVTA